MLEAERLDGLIQMATNLWGEIYYKDALAGILSREPGNLHVFTYDEGYLQGSLPAISHTLPLHSEPYPSRYGLHPFFDNLCAEGWLKNIQAQALELRGDDRFQLLLAFGTDLAGAVSVIDPEPSRDVKIDRTDPEKRRRARGKGVALRSPAETGSGKGRPGRSVPRGTANGRPISPSFPPPRFPGSRNSSI